MIKFQGQLIRILSDKIRRLQSGVFIPFFIRQQNIDNRLTDAASENGQVIIVYFCNFGMLNRALNLDNRVGVFLPCKVTLIQKPGYVEMVTINPKLISKQLNDKRLNEICDELTGDYNRILEDATI